VDVTAGSSLAQLKPTGVASDRKQAGPTLTIEYFSLGPNPLTAKANVPVTAVNKDGARHTVRSGTTNELDGIFDAEVGGGDTGQPVVGEPGTYTYVCSIHPGMKGTIEVTR